MRALVLACTVGTVSHSEINRVLAAPEWRSAEADLVARGISPAAGATMAREQPALEYLYQAIGHLLTEALDRAELHPTDQAET